MHHFAHFHFRGSRTTLDLTVLDRELSYGFCTKCNSKAFNTNIETKEPYPTAKKKEKKFSSEFPLKGVYGGSGRFFTFSKDNKGLVTKTLSIFLKLTITVV